MDHSSQGDNEVPGWETPVPRREWVLLQDSIKFLLALAEGCSNCNDISSSGALLYFMNYVPKPRYCSRGEPGLWRVHSHLSHLASPSPTSGILGENVSRPSRCLLTHPSYLQPFSPQPPPPSHSHQRGKSSFPISSVSEIVKERDPQDVPEKARVLWKGRRKMRELG